MSQDPKPLPMQLAFGVALDGRLQVTVKDASRMMSYGVTKLYELINAGEIPVIRDPLGGKAVRIAVADLLRFQQRNSTRSAIEPAPTQPER